MHQAATCDTHAILCILVLGEEVSRNALMSSWPNAWDFLSEDTQGTHAAGMGMALQLHLDVGSSCDLNNGTDPDE